MLQAIGLPVVLQALRDAGRQLRSGRILDATAVATQAAAEQQGEGQTEDGFHGLLRWGIERCIITVRLCVRQSFAAGGRSGLPAAAKRCRYWARQAASLLAPPSGVVTGSAKRRGYWARQAAWLLGPPSGVVTGPAKRRGYGPRQAAWLLGLPSGVVTGPAKRRGYWACQAASLLVPPSGVVTAFQALPLRFSHSSHTPCTYMTPRARS